MRSDDEQVGVSTGTCVPSGDAYSVVGGGGGGTSRAKQGTQVPREMPTMPSASSARASTRGLSDGGTGAPPDAPGETPACHEAELDPLGLGGALSDSE